MMVQASWQHPFRSVHLDASRILGLSGAIALNAAALMLLLMPMAAPDPVPPETVTTRIWTIPDKPIPIVPVPVPTPVVTRPVESTPQPPQIMNLPVPTVDAAVIVDQGTEQAIIGPPEQIVATITPPAGPVMGVSLEYAKAPPPAYPRAALRAGLEGTVMLQVLVGVDGRPLDVMIAASSGHRQLDEAARRHVLQRWTFRPAMRDGQAVQAVGLVPIAFDLDQ